MTAGLSYLICTTPRSGSSMLCALLAATEAAGMRPAARVGQEYFLEIVGDRTTAIERDRLLAGGLQSYVSDAFARSRTDNGVAGFKLMWAQWTAIAEMHEADRRSREPVVPAALDAAAELLPAGTRFVWLRRHDRVRQAISLVKALQSQCWNSVQQASFDAPCVFDYIGVRRAIRMYERHERGWQELFERLAVVPLEVAYEDLVEDRDGEIARLLAFLGLPAPDASPDPVATGHQRQSNAVNERWLRSYERVRSLPAPVRGAYLSWALPVWIGSRALQALRRWRRRRRIVGSPDWNGRGARPV